MPDGDLILDPARQILNLLGVFGFQAYKSGAFPDPADAPLDVPTFETIGDFLTLLGYEGSRWIGGQDQVRLNEELQTWLTDHELRAFWTPAGKLAVGVNDPRVPAFGIYNSTWLRGAIDH